MSVHTETDASGLILRPAIAEDSPLILEFIHELASYERLSHEVVATEESIREGLFVRHAAEVIIGEYDNRPVSFALFFHNFSTFLGLPGIYLEDLFVRPEMRGKGIGSAMLSHLARLAGMHR